MQIRGGVKLAALQERSIILEGARKNEREPRELSS